MDKNYNTKNQEIPTFTPPVPEFTPPGISSNGFCYQHQTESAVGDCSTCHKLMCDECFDALGVIKGEEICYDCAKELVNENITQLTQNKKIIRNDFNRARIGAILGAVLGFSLVISGGGGVILSLFAAVLWAGIGGTFINFIKELVSIELQIIKEILKYIFLGRFNPVKIIFALIKGTVLQFKCGYRTISNMFFYVNYLKETEGFIEADREKLRQLEEFMEYTIIRNNNPRVDIETLLTQHSQLAKNAFAQLAKTKTKAQMAAVVNDYISTINERGEIIRTFAKTQAEPVRLAS